jgi:Flp pilus assembly protein TadG
VSYQDDLPELLAHEPGAGERGQTLALLVIFMLSLVGMAAMAIDVGSWYQARRSIQAAADAAALAGASQLPAGWSNAQTAAQGEFAKNSKTGDSAVYANVTVNASSDSVVVTATRPTASYFAKEFGIGDPIITATARATVLAYTKVVSTGQVMPWGVMKSSWVLGSQYSLYVDNSTPNNGALALPVKDSSGTCQPPGGASDYKQSIVGPPNGNVACDVSVGEVVGVKTGQNTGPTSQGIDTRITSWDLLSSIVQMTSNGQAVILKPNSPQLLLLPVVEDMSGGSTWPSGSGSVKVIGFAYFVLTAPGYTNGGKSVVGTFVGLQSGNTNWSTGPWTPGSSTAFTIELTG